MMGGLEERLQGREGRLREEEEITEKGITTEGEERVAIWSKYVEVRCTYLSIRRGVANHC